ncbi:NmrA-like family domain-containing protein 1 [Geodia barretti]|uniref:NmrA-like family domain-containing protein 1 n=1 Tax=Geodia barretti TaxID=519541 RepID=A0AA35SKN7_GEOBA|nr:NmrA-like family domain-containing protein 1 [Geodia barretti]
MSKLITVFGATGGQGGPVAQALLRSGFRVRAVTRSTESDKAKALKDAGADVVAGSVTNAESVRAAVTGVHGVYLVTLVSPDEEQVGKAASDECKKAGVQHVVFSGLDSAKDKIGKAVHHFDSKSAVEKYLDEIGVPNTSVRFPFYFENFIDFVQYSKQSDGSYSHTLPMNGPMDAMSVADGAPIVVEVLKNPDRYIGKKVGLSAGRLTIGEYTEVISKVTGKTVKYNQVSFEQYANQPNNPFAAEMSAMYEYYSKADTPYDEKFTRSINPDTLTFQQWAKQNKEKLLKKFAA